MNKQEALIMKECPRNKLTLFISTIVSVILLLPNSLHAQQDVCNTLDYIGKNSANNFRSLRGPYDPELESYKSKVRLPNAWYCDIDEFDGEASHTCAWRYIGQKAAAKANFERLVSTVKYCVGNVARIRNSEGSRCKRTHFNFREGQPKITVKNCYRNSRRNGPTWTVRLSVEVE